VSAVLPVLALVAGLACPAHMLWRMRRGRAAGCMWSRHPVDDVSARHARLADELARLSSDRG
jgi:hypothetical protein